VVEAEDTVGDDRNKLNMEQRVMVAGMKSVESKRTKGTKKLKHRLAIAVGMKVMVTLNLATEADLANGSRGTIEDIILDPREHFSQGNLHDDDNRIMWLKYPPVMIVFKPLHYEFPPFPGMDSGLIPIFLAEVIFNIHYQNNPKTKITRRQYPLSAAYAFTDHKAQGQTIENVIVDIGTTKRFPVDPFAAYVSLS